MHLIYFPFISILLIAKGLISSYLSPFADSFLVTERQSHQHNCYVETFKCYIYLYLHNWSVNDIYICQITNQLYREIFVK